VIRSLAIACLIVPSGACAQQPSAADQVADQFLADNRQPLPTDPKLLKDRQFLDDCSGKRIRASDIKFSDSQRAITAKVHLAMQQCIDELYGTKKP
jgi:hypothetical protein